MNAQTPTILIVEDEQKIAALLEDYLEQYGFNSWTLDNGNYVVPGVRESMPDLILLDLMLPGQDGMKVCREIRSFSNVPIIMLTARVDEIDRLLGLELGADDYICKPFSPREVVARIRAVLRRVENANLNKVGVDGIEIDMERFEASVDGKALDLTPVEFRVLNLLNSEPGRVFSREQLMQTIYVDNRVVSDRTVDSHIKNLRKKLQITGGLADPITSVYGVGYRLE